MGATSTLRVRVLGPVDATGPDGDMPVRGPRERTVLGLLALTPGRPLSTERLIDGVWGEQPPATARKGLQVLVARIRRALDPRRPAGQREAHVGTTPRGYQLTPAVETDLGAFRAAIARADGPEGWQAALAMWRGPALHGTVDTPHVLAERRRLAEIRLSAVEGWADAQLVAGATAGLVTDLERLVEEHPLRERLWARLVRALAAVGRQADALETYQRAHRTLVHAAGVDPGPDLRQAQTQVLADSVGEPRDPAVVARTPAHDGLPRPRSSLVGRQRELRAVAERVGTHRLVTLIGPGGTGKTRLAVEVAARVDDREVVFCDLGALPVDTDVRPAVAAAAGLRLVSDGLDDALAQRFSEATLLVLDTCEHVVASVTATVDRLLTRTPGLTVLATSREVLGVDGEHVWPLGPLDVEPVGDDPAPAARLFADRADARQPGAVDADDPAVTALVRRLDGLPLAIELAAARTDHLTPTELVGQLAAWFDAPAPARRAVADRHTSLRATVGWSHDLLEVPARRALQELAVLQDAFDLDAAAAVTDTTAATAVDLVGRLVTTSLLEPVPTTGGTRYRMLDTIREFARGALHASGGQDHVLERHRRHLLARAREVSIAPMVRMGAALAVDPLRSDVLAALDRSAAGGDAVGAARLALMAAGLAFCPGGLGDAERALDVALDLGEAVPVAWRVDCHAARAMVGMLALRPITETTQHLRRVQSLTTPDRAPVPLAYAALATMQLTHRSPDEVAFVQHDPQGDPRPWPAAWARSFRAYGALPALASTGLDGALEVADHAYADHPWTSDETVMGWAIHAALLHVQGRDDRLRRRLTEMARLPGHADPTRPMLALFDAVAAASDGDEDRARAALAEGRQVARRTGMPRILEPLVLAAALVHHLRGRPDRCRDLLATDYVGRHPADRLLASSYRQRYGLPPLGPWDPTTPTDHLEELLDREL